MGSPRNKRLGQHFLASTATISELLAVIAPRPGQAFVEIGPGRGALSGPLLDVVGSLDVVEIDRKLAAQLAPALAGRGDLRVHAADALRFDFSKLSAQRGMLRVVGNLPYNISTPLLFHLLNQIDAVGDMVFMLQKEVAERITAEPGTKTYGRLSVMAQYRCRARLEFLVPASAFQPPPKVESAVVCLQPSRPRTPATDEQRLAALVNKAFSQRRKTLRNALQPEFAQIDLAAAGIEPQRRPETLSVEEFVRLANS